MSNVITEINNYVTIRSFENKDGETIKYIAGSDLKSAKPNNLLRAMVETGITAKELLQMVETPKKKKKTSGSVNWQTGEEYAEGKDPRTGTRQSARAVGKAQGVQPIVDKLKSINEEKKIILLGRLTTDVARLVDLNLRGKKGTNRGQRVSDQKVLQTICNSLSLDYQVTPDLEFINVGFRDDDDDFSDIFGDL